MKNTRGFQFTDNPKGLLAEMYYEEYMKKNRWERIKLRIYYFIKYRV